MGPSTIFLCICMSNAPHWPQFISNIQWPAADFAVYGRNKVSRRVHFILLVYILSLVKIVTGQKFGGQKSWICNHKQNTFDMRIKSPSRGVWKLFNQQTLSHTHQYTYNLYLHTDQTNCIAHADTELALINALVPFGFQNYSHTILIECVCVRSSWSWTSKSPSVHQNYLATQ